MTDPEDLEAEFAQFVKECEGITVPFLLDMLGDVEVPELPEDEQPPRVVK
jgi:hypothetical protein